MDLNKNMAKTEINFALGCLEQAKKTKMTISGDKDEINRFFDSFRTLQQHLNMAIKFLENEKDGSGTSESK